MHLEQQRPLKVTLLYFALNCDFECVMGTVCCVELTSGSQELLACYEFCSLPAFAHWTQVAEDS